jgi:hypothetical protein
MGFVTLEEVEVNFTQGIHYPQHEEAIFYPFGVWDEQVVQYNEPTSSPLVVESDLIPGYLAISANCKLGRHLQHIANLYGCVDLRKFDKIFLPNPNNNFCQKPLSLVDTLCIYFVGIYCTPTARIMLVKII